MADSREDVTIKVGIKGGETKEIVVKIAEDKPVPWGIDQKYAVVGTGPRRMDAVAKATGRAKYTYDINLPNMVHARFVRCPWAAAEVASIDFTEALNVPGVVYGEKWDWRKDSKTGLDAKLVKYPWQPVGLLAAESKQALEAGLRAVKVEYKRKPHAARLDQALAEGAPVVHDNMTSNKDGQNAPAANVAKADAALAEAAKIVAGTATTSVQTHSCLETHGVVVDWGPDDKVRVYASTQATFGVREQFARGLNLKQSDVQVITHYMGGGFGSKFGLGDFGRAAGVVAKALKRPVKFMLDRKEEHMTGGNRPDSVQAMTLGVKSDGTLSGYKVEKHGTGGVAGGAGARNPLIYEVGPTASSEHAVSTNAGAAAAFRAPGHPQGAFAMEAILDMAAEAIGMDPLALRRKNDEHPIRNVQYVEGAKLFGWDKRKKNGSDQGPIKRGMGVASCVWFQLGGPGATCLCRIRRDGSVEIRNGAQDIGTGTRTIMAMVVAEELGLTLDRVASFMGDTNDPVGPASGGSVTAPIVMPAARRAAFLAGKELRELAAKKLGCEANDLVCAAGKISHVSDKSKSMSFDDACKLMEVEAVETTGVRDANFKNFTGQTAGVQFAEVEVDTETGKVKVLRFLAMQDSGTIINKMTAASQVNGAVIQGVSYALFEERHIDRHKGQQINADFDFYKIAGPKDIPEIQVVLTDVNMGANNVGIAGLGEGPAVGPAAAVANAVHNALGVRVWSLPMTPDRVLAALAANAERIKQGGGK